VQPTQTVLFLYCLVFPLFCPSPVFASIEPLIMPNRAGCIKINFPYCITHSVAGICSNWCDEYRCIAVK